MYLEFRGIRTESDAKQLGKNADLKWVGTKTHRGKEVQLFEVVVVHDDEKIVYNNKNCKELHTFFTSENFI